MQDLIKDRIYQIEKTLSVHESEISSGGLSEGMLGLSLFYFYFYHFTANEELLEKVTYYIDRSISLMHDNSDLELIELGRYLCFLNVNGYLDDVDLVSYLQELDIILAKGLQIEIDDKNLDSISGIIPLGHYYLASSKHINRTSELMTILDAICNQGKEGENGIFWLFTHNTGKTTIELGIAHGISGILCLLVSYIELGIEKEKCLSLINGGIKYILSQSSFDAFTMFPIDALSKKRIRYFNLAYGDIGIAHLLFRAGAVTKQGDFVDCGLQILENAARFRDDLNVYVKDAELIYGSAGLQLIFEHFYASTTNPLFLEASKYWLNKSLSHNINNTPWVGYDTYINGFSNQIQLSFAHGICGIGISLILHALGESNCLQFLKFE